jgi:hypothetical protein
VSQQLRSSWGVESAGILTKIWDNTSYRFGASQPTSQLLVPATGLFGVEYCRVLGLPPNPEGGMAEMLVSGQPLNEVAAIKSDSSTHLVRFTTVGVNLVEKPIGGSLTIEDPPHLAEALVNPALQRWDDPFYVDYFRNRAEIKIMRFSPREFFILCRNSGFLQIGLHLAHKFKRIVLALNLCTLLFCYAQADDFRSGSALIQALHISVDITMFNNITDLVSAKFKAGMIAPKCLTETKGLFGYKTLPSDDWDPVLETEKLASGGQTAHATVNGWEEHCLRALEKLDTEAQYTVTGVNKVRCSIGERSKIIITDLRQYIESGDWEVTGSSSIGKVTVSINGEQKKIKCRKNTLLDSGITVEEIYRQCLSLNQSVSTGFTKEEPQKYRIVVGSDVLMVIMMKFVMQWFELKLDFIPGLSYRDTPDYFERKANHIIDAINKKYAIVNFDFKSFERQPTRSEMSMITDWCCSHVKHAPTADGLEVCQVIKTCMSNQVLQIRDQTGKLRRFKQYAGLSSGVAWTTIYGGLFNLMAFTAAATTLNMPPLEFMLAKGDDSVCFDQKPGKVVAVINNLLSAQIQAKVGGWGVQGRDVHLNPTSNVQSEFLRRTITKDGVSGFPARSCVIATFKPYAPDSDPVWGKWTGFIDGLQTTLRRVGIHNPRSAIFQMFGNLRPRGMDMPTDQGGAGLFKKKIVLSSMNKQDAKNSLDVQVKLTEARKNQIVNKASWINLGEKELQAYNNISFRQKLINADYPALKADARREAKRILKDSSFTSTNVSSAKFVNFMSRSKVRPVRMEFGTAPEVLVMVTEVKKIMNCGVKKPFLALCREYDKSGRLTQKLLNSCRKLKMSYGRAAKYLAGDLPFGFRPLVAPQLADRFTKTVAALLESRNFFSLFTRDGERRAMVCSAILWVENRVEENYPTNLNNW